MTTYHAVVMMDDGTYEYRQIREVTFDKGQKVRRAAAFKVEGFQYTLNYTKAGPATAFNLRITDPLAGLLVTPQFNSNGPLVTRKDGLWQIAELDVDQSGSLTVWGQINPSFCGERNLTVEINTTTYEVNLLNNQVVIRVRVLPVFCICL